VEQAALTAPYLERALARLPQLKRERKIFFVNHWLAAFLGGQTDAASLRATKRFLRDAKLDPDLRRKVLEALDGLERTAGFAPPLPTVGHSPARPHTPPRSAANRRSTCSAT
jgi:hypothetical protein